MVIRKAGMVALALATIPVDVLALAILFGGPAPPHGPARPPAARPPAARPAPHPAPPATRPAPSAPRPPAPLHGWRLHPYNPEGWADTPADLEGPTADEPAMA